MIVALSSFASALIGGPQINLGNHDTNTGCQGALVSIYGDDSIVIRNVTMDDGTADHFAYIFNATSTDCDTLQQKVNLVSDFAEFTDDANVTFAPGESFCITYGNDASSGNRGYDSTSSYPFLDGNTNMSSFATQASCTGAWAFDTNLILNIFQYEFDLVVVVETDSPLISNCICTSCIEGTNNTVDVNPTINCTVIDDTGVQAARIANDTLSFANMGSSRNGTAEDADTWVLTLTTADKLTNYYNFQTLCITANDTLGNAHSNCNVTIDVMLINNPPTAPTIYYPVNGKNYSNITSINFSSTDSDNDAITFNGYINGNLNFSSTTNLTTWNASDGFYELKISATDGINSSANTTINFRLDTVAPSWSNNQTNASLMRINGNATFNITVSDYGSTLSYYIFSWNGTGIWDNATNGSISGTSVKLVINKSPTVSQGSTIGYRWYANDSAGNWNSSLLRTFDIVSLPIEDILGRFSVNHTEFPDDWTYYSHLQFDLKGDGSNNRLSITLQDDDGTNATQSVGNFSLSSTSWTTVNISFVNTSLWTYSGGDGVLNVSNMNKTHFVILYNGTENGNIYIDELKLYNYTIPAKLFTNCVSNYSSALDTSTDSVYICNITSLNYTTLFLWIDYYDALFGMDFNLDVTAVKT